MQKGREANSKIVKPLRGGQMTIPAEFREALRIDQNTLLKVTLEAGEMRVRPMRMAESTDGSAWLKELYDLFAPLRQDLSQYSEVEINEAIQQAVAKVRQNRRD